jgi:hypothetical protein
MLGLGAAPGEMGHSFIPGVRHTPGYQPTPNSEPLGSETGAPPRPRWFSMQVAPYGTKNAPVLIAPETRDNRIVTVVSPSVGFTVYVGDAGVSPLNGYALSPGVSDDFALVGFQSLYAVTDAPVFLRLQIKIFSILLAERERRL